MIFVKKIFNHKFNFCIIINYIVFSIEIINKITTIHLNNFLFLEIPRDWQCLNDPNISVSLKTLKNRFEVELTVQEKILKKCWGISSIIHSK